MEFNTRLLRTTFCNESHLFLDLIPVFVTLDSQYKMTLDNLFPLWARHDFPCLVLHLGQVFLLKCIYPLVLVILIHSTVERIRLAVMSKTCKYFIVLLGFLTFIL